MKYLWLILIAFPLHAQSVSNSFTLAGAAGGGGTPANPNFSHVHTAKGVVENGTVTVTCTQSATSGNLIVWVIGTTPRATIPADNHSGSYSRFGIGQGRTDNADSIVCFWGIANFTGSVTYSVTATTGDYVSFSVMEFHCDPGFDASSRDQMGGNAQTSPGTGTDAVTSGATGTRSTQYEIIVGGLADQSSGTQTYTAGTNYIIPTNGTETNGAARVTYASEYRFIATTGTEATTFTMSPNVATATIARTFKAAGQ